MYQLKLLIFLIGPLMFVITENATEKATVKATVKATEKATEKATSFHIMSNFTGIGRGVKSVGMIAPPPRERPKLTSKLIAAMKARRDACQAKYTPRGACKFVNADNLYGRWYVSSIPGLPRGSPICEKVDFFPGATQHEFNKVLQLHLRNGTWFKQKQNGTIIAPGKILLELDLTMFNIPKIPRVQLNYTMIDFDPQHYITAFLCMRGMPVVPVLTRSRKPSMEVWAKIFSGVLKAGCSLSWMDLYCHPSSNRTFAEVSATAPDSSISSVTDEVVF